MSLRSKTALYRRCHLVDVHDKDASDGLTLQGAIARAAETVIRPWVRAMGAGGSAHQLLTDIKLKNSCLCGEIVYYEPGRKIPLVDIEKDGSTWRDTIHPNDSSGKPRNLQEQSLYFAIRENHIAILQSVSLQADDLQGFLSWLIQERGGLLPSAAILIQNPPAASAIQKLKDHSIRGIKIGERLFTSVRDPAPPKPGSARKRYVQRIETSPRVLQILLALGVDRPVVEKLASNPDPGAIQVDVDISYRSRNEKESIAVLYALANTIGKQDGLDPEIRLDGKSSIKGSELTIRGEVKVQCPDGCIAMDDALSKLSHWLAQQIKSGRV